MQYSYLLTNRRRQIPQQFVTDHTTYQVSRPQVLKKRMKQKFQPRQSNDVTKSVSEVTLQIVTVRTFANVTRYKKKLVKKRVKRNSFL